MSFNRTIVFWVSLIGILAAFAVSYCLFLRPRPPVPVIQQVPIDELPVFKDMENNKGLQEAVSASLEYLNGRKELEQLPWGSDAVTVGALKETLNAFSSLLEQDLHQEEFQREIRRLFTVYRVTSGDDKRSPGRPVLVTGYFQPELVASLQPDERFSYPLYETPPDLIHLSIHKFDQSLPRKTLWGRVSGQSLIPYYTRADIDIAKDLKNAEVLAWLRTPVDGLMLHIQGSGLLRLKDGSRRHIHYASSNGHSYHSIGKWLINQGLLRKDQADWPGICVWAQENPEKFHKALAVNPRYIFFKWENEGPIGSLGEVLTPMRSVALDHSIYPPGILCFLQVPLPSKSPAQKSSGMFQGFVCNQDTGSAIKGPHRLDLYCGEGDKAGELAGTLRTPGSLYLFLLRKN